jgi:hypothetical protein
LRLLHPGRELEAAMAALRPPGIEPVLDTQEINEAAFKANSSEPNRL